MTTASRALARRLRVCKRVVSLGVAAILACTAFGCGASTSYVARVGVSEIHEQEVHHWSSAVASAGGADADKRRLRETALRFLIRAAWVGAEARERGLKVSMEQAKHQLEFLRFKQARRLPLTGLPRDALLRRLLLAENLSPADGEWLMRLSLLTAQVEQAWLAQAARKVSRRAVARYYATHKAQFVEPAVSNIEIIGNNDATIVRRARREIDAGARFLDVARRASEDPEAHEGLQRLVRGTEEPPFEKEIFGAKPGVLIGPIHQVLYYIFVVLSAKPDRQETLAQADGAIRKKLAPKLVASTVRPAFETKWLERTTCRAQDRASCSSRELGQGS